jgi:hypothetical protein
MQKAGIQPLPLVERAYQLARSGDFRSLREIELQLRREGYVIKAVREHLEGQAIRASLSTLCKSATAGAK